MDCENQESKFIRIPYADAWELAKNSEYVSIYHFSTVLNFLLKSLFGSIGMFAIYSLIDLVLLGSIDWISNAFICLMYCGVENLIYGREGINPETYEEITRGTTYEVPVEKGKPWWSFWVIWVGSVFLVSTIEYIALYM